jgi:hypothetical protein
MRPVLPTEIHVASWGRQKHELAKSQLNSWRSEVHLLPEAGGDCANQLGHEAIKHDRVGSPASPASLWLP